MSINTLWHVGITFSSLEKGSEAYFEENLFKILSTCLQYFVNRVNLDVSQIFENINAHIFRPF
jgi:hypothetical protein